MKDNEFLIDNLYQVYDIHEIAASAFFANFLIAFLERYFDIMFTLSKTYFHNLLDICNIEYNT